MHGCALDIGNPSTSGKPTYVLDLYFDSSKTCYWKDCMLTTTENIAWG